VAKATRDTGKSICARTHIVLVPGFCGFDALGQLEYYAGVTPRFRRWKRTAGSDRQNVVLHYFDSFPTAAVVTRAALLRNYLVKRIARGEFLPADSLALVGHSTGGLDIRQLIWDLAGELERNTKLKYAVDGTQDTSFAVSGAGLLHMLNRVVFLSVPQFGTNIADWVRDHDLGRRAVVADLRASIAASQVPVLDQLQNCVSGSLATATNLDLLDAIQDALSEAEPDRATDRMHVALAEDAAADLALWLRHIATDFSAIDDLASEVLPGNATSPAHFDNSTRKQEIGYWKHHHIQTRSFATIGTRPFNFDPEHPSPRWDLLNPFSYPETTPSTPESAGTDIVYRACYRACAGGPFDYPNVDTLPNPPLLVDDAGTERPIARWDNDGIANTASMLWPNARETLLINADHMDIVGHYHRVPAADVESERKYQAYDLLKSASGFDAKLFASVWNGVFDFCAPKL
jgi:triacylglycerol lipase